MDGDDDGNAGADGAVDVNGNVDVAKLNIVWKGKVPVVTKFKRHIVVVKLYYNFKKLQIEN